MTPEERARRVVGELDGDYTIPIYALEAIERNAAREIVAALIDKPCNCGFVVDDIISDRSLASKPPAEVSEAAPA